MSNVRKMKPPTLRIVKSPRAANPQVEIPKKNISLKPILPIKKSPRGEAPKQVLTKPKISPRQVGHISQVPSALFPSIMKDLDPTDILSICQTSKGTYGPVCGNPEFWRGLLRENYPKEFNKVKTVENKNLDYWIEAYKSAYFSELLLKRAQIYSYKGKGKVTSGKSIKAKFENIKRGDLIKHGSDIYIFDGELQLLQLNTVTYIPEQFEVITEFPPNYWDILGKEKYIDRHIIPMWFNANRFMDQIMENLIIAEENGKKYLRSTFKYKVIEYTLIFYSGSKKFINQLLEAYKNNTNTDKILSQLISIFASRMYSFQEENPVNVEYPKNKTLFLLFDAPKYFEIERRLEKAAAKKDLKEYAHIVNNIDISNLSLESLIDFFSDRFQAEFWVEYPYIQLDLALLSSIPLSSDDLFYKGLKHPKYAFNPDYDFRIFQIMLNVWKDSKKDKKQYAERIKAIYNDPKLNPEDKKELEEMMNNMKFKIDVSNPKGNKKSMNIKKLDFAKNFIITDTILGKGADSYVVLVKDAQNKEYALKVTSIKKLIKYVKEFEILSKLSSCHNIVKSYDLFTSEIDIYGKNEENVYLLLEYLGDNTLAEYIDSDDFDLENVSKIIRDLVSGIKCMHDLNIVHLDLHPENILINDENLKIIDFGESCQIDGSEHIKCNRENIFTDRFKGSAYNIKDIGTIPPDFKSFEDGTIESYDYLKSVDIYALGGIIFEILDPLDEEDIPENLFKIAKLCKKADYKKRPTIDKIISMLY